MDDEFDKDGNYNPNFGQVTKQEQLRRDETRPKSPNAAMSNNVKCDLAAQAGVKILSSLK